MSPIIKDSTTGETIEIDETDSNIVVQGKPVAAMGDIGIVGRITFEPKGENYNFKQTKKRALYQRNR